MENSELLCRWLDSGEIDFAILEGYFHKEDYDSMLYRTERYLAVCAQDYPFQNTPHQLADLLGETLLVREEGIRQPGNYPARLSRKNLALQDFHSLFEVGDMNVLKQMLVQGCGIGFLYEAAVQEDLQRADCGSSSWRTLPRTTTSPSSGARGASLHRATGASMENCAKTSRFFKTGQKKGKVIRRIPSLVFFISWQRLHHAAHACARSACHSVIFLFAVSNQRFGGQYHRSNRGSVLQSGTGNLGWVNDTGWNHVNVGFIVSVVAVANLVGV